MEIIYLLCSIVSNVITSLSLSIILLFRSVLLRCFCIWSPAPSYSAAANGEEPVALYQGTVWHERRRPVRHCFQYSVRYALIDLDHASNATVTGHLSADEARQFAGTNGRVLLLTIPPSVGYEQNPLSVYYCYDFSSSSLQNCIAEVTNTPWGENVRFVFNPSSDLVAKPLHVSPFMDMQGNWNIKANAPGETLSVAISVQHPELGNYFTATLKAEQIESSSSSADNAWFFWLMPHKVALWIYWHALKLWWKNVVFIQHPRYSNPAYREEATMRDQDLQCCRGGVDKSNNNNNNNPDRCFVWKDAKWPWS